MPPLVSIIVPCYNEQDTIRLLLEAVFGQTFPRQEMEVVIADGRSTDRTRQEIAAFQHAHPELRVSIVDNPRRIIPAGLNRAIAAATGEFIIRLDAHAVPSPNYVASCVEVLQAGLGENVGGEWEVQPIGKSWPARAISAAAVHPLGVGDARYRLGGFAQAVDTVPFGAFRRSLVERIGEFDETLLTNEDYEFNARIRKSGGRIWFDPAIRSVYFARRSFSDLATQYWRYGFWKARMLKRYPETFRWRQLAGVFVLSIPLLAILGIWFTWARWLLVVEVAVYYLALLFAGVQVAIKEREAAYIIGLPLAIATMHFAWGAAFIWSSLVMLVHPRGVPKSRRWRFRTRERRTLLLIGDFITALIALVIALYNWASAAEWLGFSLEFLKQRPPTWFYLLPFVWLILLVELYDIHRAGNWRTTVRGVATAAIIGLGLYLLLYFYFTDPPKSLLPRRGVAGFLIAASLLTLMWRFLYIKIFTAPAFLRRVLLVGAGKAGQTLLRVINDLWPPPFHLVGIIDDDPQKIGTSLENYSVMAGSESLLEIIELENVSDIIVAISGEMHGSTFQTLLDAQERGVEITRMPVVYEELLGRVPIRLLEADWILRSFVDQSRVNQFSELGKRLVDILGGVVGILFLLLTFPFFSLGILLDSGRPVFYSQMRAGRGAQPYRILKYRTMRQDAEADGQPQWAKEDDERATRIGRFLRRTHMDELPQFINVLRGEMSLVGPRAERPELVAMYQKYVPFYRSRLLVKPGITGWAQINFGYASTIDETVVKLEYDLYYIKHRNLLMDFMIILRTPATVFGLRGQ